jgi:hypothetical protein
LKDKSKTWGSSMKMITIKKLAASDYAATLKEGKRMSEKELQALQNLLFENQDGFTPLFIESGGVSLQPLLEIMTTLYRCY